MRHETRKIERTPEQLAELKAIRERFQREKPTFEQLRASGDLEGSMPNAAYFGLMAFAVQLRSGREAAGLSLKDVAARTGLDEEVLRQLETGRLGNPSVNTLAWYAHALGKVVTFGLTDQAPASPPAGKKPAAPTPNGGAGTRKKRPAKRRA
jgi:ribosome-binding protein aMBF1 (putative translation factor)